MVKNLPPSAGASGDKDLMSGLGRSPEGGNGNLLQYSCCDKPHGLIHGAWWARVHGVTKSQTQLVRKELHTPLEPLQPAFSSLSLDMGLLYFHLICFIEE